MLLPTTVHLVCGGSMSALFEGWAGALHPRPMTVAEENRSREAARAAARRQLDKEAAKAARQHVEDEQQRRVERSLEDKEVEEVPTGELPC